MSSLNMLENISFTGLFVITIMALPEPVPIEVLSWSHFGHDKVIDL